MDDQVLFEVQPSEPGRNTLTRVYGTGRFWFSPPEGPTTRLSVVDTDPYPLDACAVEAGLSDGWWLRAGEFNAPYRATWTWVQR